mmetsp:Transcript_29296/g.40260  ORF Transcript_29296/g.40260 Transcript_29296/m.40260 type:complete len:89 (+) Transcript_29296:25-291(+)
MAVSAWQSYIDFMIARGNIEKAMIVSSEDAALWVTSHEDDSSGSGGYCLREYSAQIMQEDGSERDEIVNEAKNLLVFMNPAKPPGASN